MTRHRITAARFRRNTRIADIKFPDRFVRILLRDGRRAKTARRACPTSKSSTPRERRPEIAVPTQRWRDPGRGTPRDRWYPPRADRCQPGASQPGEFTLCSGSSRRFGSRRDVSKWLKTGGNIGDPGRIRTCDHSLRRRVLYPAELRGRVPGTAALIASRAVNDNHRGQRRRISRGLGRNGNCQHSSSPSRCCRGAR